MCIMYTDGRGGFYIFRYSSVTFWAEKMDALFPLVKFQNITLPFRKTSPKFSFPLNFFFFAKTKS